MPPQSIALPAPLALETQRALRLAERYREVRAQTERLCEPLAIEDYVVSSMPDVSPTKWHLAHTTWFFETFVLAAHLPGYAPLNPKYAFLFNSYYVQAGERHCRAQRGLVTRPTVEEVREYRAHVDERMASLCERAEDERDDALAALIELGLNHEQQHQELLLTDIKHVFWTNPMRPAYTPRAPEPAPAATALRWSTIGEGLREIGRAASSVGDFAYDNESPRHRVFVEGFRLASRLVTNGEYLAFVEDGGYRKATLWLSNGFATVQERHWQAPLYWERRGDGWWEFTLAGDRPLDPNEPVTHLSFYEADAFARWAGARLPSEAEWETAAADAPVHGRFVDARRFHPGPAADDGAPLEQLYGDAWQWTRSPYVPYPGFAPAPGAVGEYNGKFMCDQWVLRGASCATPASHARLTYRNFFPADARWQFTGLRLASDA